MTLSNKKIEEMKKKMQKDLDDDNEEVSKSEIKKLVEKLTN